MVAAMDWFSHTTHYWIWWMVVCFGFNGLCDSRPISVYVGPSPKEEERKEKG